MMARELRAAWRALRARLETHAPREAVLPRLDDRDQPPTPPRSESVDVVVCVRDALDATRECLTSVVATTTQPYRLVVVDDASDPATAAFLDAFVAGRDVRLIRHEHTQGYTRAANAGLRASTAPWVILLNSDTVVTQGWVDRMWAHGHRDPTVGLIGPLSNSAAWQSAPYLNAGGEWLSSQLPDGMSVEEIGRIVAGFGHASIRLPFLNGFCYMIRRRVIDDVGLLDEERFGEGYGEEHDFSIRAARAGWTSVVAADVYVFHAGSRSYGTAAKRSLIPRAEQALRAKHGADHDIDRRVEQCRTNIALAGVRGRLQSGLERRRLACLGAEKWSGRRVAFALTGSALRGVTRTVLQEARALERMGVAVTLLSLVPREVLADECPPSMDTRYFADQSAVNAHLRGERYDAVVGTSFTPACALPDEDELRHTAVAYHLHHLEDWIAAPPETVAPDFRAYAERGRFRLLTRTRALADEVRIYTGHGPCVVPASVDLDRFYPRDREASSSGSGDGRVVVSAMLRPSARWRAPLETLAALERCVNRLRGRVVVHLFGADDEALAEAGLTAPWARRLGVLRQAEMAALLNGSDVVLDLSTRLAFGVLPLEAMACGCAVVLSHRGGASALAHHLTDALVVDGDDAREIARALERLADDAELRRRLQRAAVDKAFRYTAEAAASAVMDALFPCGADAPRCAPRTPPC